MAEFARVDNTKALEQIDQAISKFAHEVTLALAEAESEISRTREWLARDQQAYWKGRIRKAEQLVQRAREALNRKKLYKTPSGRPANTEQEQKDLKRAIAGLEHARQKLENVGRWKREMERQALLYRGQVQAAANMAEATMPKARQRLAAMLDHLAAYERLATTGSSNSMTRAPQSPANSDDQASDGQSGDDQTNTNEATTIDPEDLNPFSRSPEPSSASGNSQRDTSTAGPPPATDKDQTS